MSRTKAAGMIGMAMKAGKVASGEFSTEKAVKEGRAWLVVVAEDASANTCAAIMVSRSAFLQIRSSLAESLEENSARRLQ